MSSIVKSLLQIVTFCYIYLQEIKQNNKTRRYQIMFAPIVIATRKFIGKKQFNKIRGKAIGLHSKTITKFCKAVGIDSKKRQSLIRLAKNNGKTLGFLA